MSETGSVSLSNVRQQTNLATLCSGLQEASRVLGRQIDRAVLSCKPGVRAAMDAGLDKMSLPFRAWLPTSRCRSMPLRTTNCEVRGYYGEVGLVPCDLTFGEWYGRS